MTSNNTFRAMSMAVINGATCIEIDAIAASKIDKAFSAGGSWYIRERDGDGSSDWRVD